jgi:hypothetical protein
MTKILIMAMLENLLDFSLSAEGEGRGYLVIGI